MLSLAIFILVLTVNSGVNGNCVGAFGGSEYSNEYGQYKYQDKKGAYPPPPKNQGSDPFPNIGYLVQGVPYTPAPLDRLLPVRVTSEVAKPATYPLLQISVNKKAKLISRNDGYLVFSVPAGPGKVATLTDGPANNTYEFGLLAQNQVYFTPNARSSTTEDDFGFAAQIQFFLYNVAYGSFSNALQYSDGLIIILFDILVQGTTPNKKAQPYVDLLDRLEKPNSTSYIDAYDALDWLLIALEPDYYVYLGSYIDIITARQYPCATVIQPNFQKLAYVSIPQYKSFTNLVNRNYQPEINPLPLYLLAGRDVFQGYNSPVAYKCFA